VVIAVEPDPELTVLIVLTIVGTLFRYAVKGSLAKICALKLLRIGDREASSPIFFFEQLKVKEVSTINNKKFTFFM